MTARRRCLVIGASGQLGQALCAVLGEAHEVLAAHHAPAAGQLQVDLGAPEAAAEAVRRLAPDWIMIAGALCNVDLCETERDRCQRVNVEGPRAVAEQARALGAAVVYYSTDHVFDGTQASYQETDAPHPLNVYARSKVEGEAAIRETLPDRHLILRTAWLYGPDRRRRNFILRLRDQVAAGRTVRVPHDQWGSPTYTEDVAAATRRLLERGLHGTFHATGPDYLDRMALARQVCAAFGLDVQHVHGVPTAQLRQPAYRPLRVRLDCRALTALALVRFRRVAEGLQALPKGPASLAGRPHG